MLYCVPASGWNGQLVVYAHGYTAFNEDLDFYNLTLPDGTYMPALVQSLGFAFATTSYRRNGLAILEGVQDVRNAVQGFRGQTGLNPAAVYITGPSEGGAVAALSAERSADVFDASLSLCGPIGDFRKQVNYWGDFRTLYDYFFPGVLPGNTIDVPDELIAGWGTVYTPAVAAALQANPLAAAQLIRTSAAPIDRRDPLNTTGQTTLGLLWYNVFATEDGQAQLGGNPYDNLTRIYRGSANDTALNTGVNRFPADLPALAGMQPYNTTGTVKIPLVTLHTTGDEIIPFWHQTLFAVKAAANKQAAVTQIPINRYGHCNFKTEEVLVGFALMVLQGTGQQMFVPPQYNIRSTRAAMEAAAASFAAQPAENAVE